MQGSLKLWHVTSLCLVLCVLGQQAEAKKDERDCEVCIAVLDKFRKATDEAVIKDPKKSEAAFKKFCMKLPSKGKENKFCYYIGGTEDAATATLNQISQPLSYFMPSNKICEKLKKKDPQICDLRFDKKPDFSKLNKMRVNELKRILSNWGEENACKGCAEKSDFIKKIKELLPKHDKEEYEKLQKQEL